MLSLVPGISSKHCDSDFFHNYISIKRIKEFYPEIIWNSFKFVPGSKHDVKLKYRNSM